MMLTCGKCGRKHPMTDEDVAFFYPRFFCLSCGEKLEFVVADAKLATLRNSNDRSRTLAAADLQGLPPSDQLRKVVKRGDGAGDGGG
ncbi:MAG TPA: hypothetical protein VF950_29625 [Planctomycetota bacterium]